jgi:hypothetical protein
VNGTVYRFLDEVAAIDQRSAEHLFDEIEGVFEDPRALDASDRITFVAKQIQCSIGARCSEVWRVLERVHHERGHR